MLSLTAIAAVTGVVLLWTWKRFSKPERIAAAKRQARARLYAIRLYADDPPLALRAQRQLLPWVARYLAEMLRPAAVATVPLFILFVQLDHDYGHRPLAAGESAIVTAQFASGVDLRVIEPALEGRDVVVETPAVRIPGRHQVCWRVRAATASGGSVLLRAPGVTVAKALRCGWGLHIPPMPWNGLPSVDVGCPPATLDVVGYGINWLVWFLAVSLVTMLLLRKRFGVVL